MDELSGIVPSLIFGLILLGTFCCCWCCCSLVCCRRKPEFNRQIVIQRNLSSQQNLASNQNNEIQIYKIPIDDPPPSYEEAMSNVR